MSFSFADFVAAEHVWQVEHTQFEVEEEEA